MENEIIEQNLQNLKTILTQRKALGKKINKNSPHWQNYRERVHYRLLKVIKEAERTKSLTAQEMLTNFINLKTGSEQLKEIWIQGNERS